MVAYLKRGNQGMPGLKSPEPAGRVWWADEPSETRLDRFTGQRPYLAALLALSAACFVALHRHPPQCDTTPADFLGSTCLSPFWLATFRVTAASATSLLLAYNLCTEVVIESETLGRRPIPLIYSGLWRMQGLSQWQLAAVAAYFQLSALLTLSALDVLPPLGEARATSRLACLANALLGVAFCFALLTCAVVSHVLVPARIARGGSVAPYFRWDQVAMHNGTLALIGGEVLVATLRVEPRTLPLAILVGAAYLVVTTRRLNRPA